jgi:hypothetical protein
LQSLGLDEKSSGSVLKLGQPKFRAQLFAFFPGHGLGLFGSFFGGMGRRFFGSLFFFFGRRLLAVSFFWQAVFLAVFWWLAGRFARQFGRARCWAVWGVSAGGFFRSFFLFWQAVFLVIFFWQFSGAICEPVWAGRFLAVQQNIILSKGNCVGCQKQFNVQPKQKREFMGHRLTWNITDCTKRFQLAQRINWS